MKKITILMLHLQHGGIEKQISNLANELCKDYEVEIISTYSMKALPAYTLDKQIQIKYLMDEKPNRDEIKNAVRTKNITEIIKQGFKAIKILYTKKRRMVNEIKKLDCDYVLSTRIEFADMLSTYAPKGVTTLTQEHLHDDSKKYIIRAKKAFRNLDYLLVLCKGSKDNFSRWLADNKKIKIELIPNILKEIPDENASISGNRLVSVGRLHPVKNFNTLIDIFGLVQKEIPDATLTIVGGGDEYESLKQKATELGLDNKINITGMVSAETVKEYMLSSDLYVMTSHTECFPMVLLEASSLGLPLIAFDVPVGPKAIITGSKNGYLIEYEDKKTMASTIVKMLRDREKLCSLGKNAKENSYKYTPENIMPLWHKIFN